MTKKRSKIQEIRVTVDKTINPMTGTKIKEFTEILTDQVLNSAYISDRNNQDDVDKKLVASFAVLHAIQPKDETEAMLAAQMIASHNAAMECFRRAMLRDQTFAGRDLALKYAAKLSRNYSLLMETLDKHRGKTTQQKVTVEHVHVHAGGQAIVGAVNHEGGEGKTRKGESIP